MRYIDLEENGSSLREESSVRNSEKYKTPVKKIVLGKKKKRKRKKEKMFNNSYLNCYFQMHEETKKKLEQTNMSFGGDSIKTKKENDSMFSLNHENIFNQP